MSEVKHTPGPWKFGGITSLGSGLGYYCIGTSDGSTIICNVDNRPPGDAHLIVAAPELLEALQEVMGWIRNWDPGFTADEEWSDTQAKVDAAIAKATGKAVV